MIGRAIALIGLPSWLGPVIIGGAVVAVVGGIFGAGYKLASTQCKTANLERELYAQALTVLRYRQAAEQSAAQLQQEASDNATREVDLTKRLAELEAERAREALDDAALELQLDAAISDKDKLNAIVAQLRKKTRTSCGASDADVDLDRRMQKH